MIVINGMSWEYTFVSTTGWDKFPKCLGHGKSGGAPCGRGGGFPKSVADGKSGGGVVGWGGGFPKSVTNGTSGGDDA